MVMSFAAVTSYAQGPSRDETSIDPRNNPSTQQRLAQDKKQFAQNMFMANLAEVQMGQLGVQHATSPQVKAFAQMMVTEHTKANQELVPVAKQLEVQQPTALDEKHQAIADRLSKLHGAEFDKAFMKAMVDAHREAAAMLGPMAGIQSAQGESGGAGDAGSTGVPPGTSSSTGTTGSQSAGSQATGTSGSGASTSTSANSGAAQSGAQSVGTSGAGAGAATTPEQYAAKTLASVNLHLQQAQQLQDQLDK
jgi:putative membrane protein